MIACLTAPGLALADEIYSTFGPSNAYNGFDNDAVTFSLHSSTGGLPGAVLHSEIVSIFSVPSTVAIHHIDFSDFDATLQAATTYWFSVGMVAPSPAQNNGQWWFNNQGHVGLATRTSDGGSWNHQATL